MTSSVRSTPTQLALGLGVLVTLLATLLLGAPPAQAAYSIAFTPSGGTVGTPIVLTASVSSGQAGVGVGKVTYVAGGTAVATAAVDATGVVAAASWTPLTAGSVAVYAAYASTDGTQAATSSSSSVSIARAPTVTTLTMPATARVGTAVRITAAVTAGAYIPTGSVTFLLPDGTVLTAATLDANGVATISVQMPAQPSTYQVSARYNPDANTLGSTSVSGSTLVTETGSNVALSVSSSTVVVGTPVTLTAAITPSTATGTVTFQAGATVLGSAAVTGGKATLAWTPTAGGAVTLTAAYRATGSSVVTGTTSVVVTVVATLPADRITIGPVGQAPWAPRAGYPLRNASSVTVASSSQSGAPVTLAISGPCTLTGQSIRASTGSGSCTLSASSPGRGSFGPGTQVNIMTLIRGVQTATLNPPPAGTLQRGRYYRLAAPGTVTSAGNPVKWRVSFAPKRCKVLKQSDGSYLLRAKKVGRCNVKAYSKTVPGQWLSFKKYYRYTVRY